MAINLWTNRRRTILQLECRQSVDIIIIIIWIPLEMIGETFNQTNTKQ